MDWSAAHAGFVTASYAISAASIGGLIIYVFRRDAAAKRALAKIESAGRG